MQMTKRGVGLEQKPDARSPLQSESPSVEKRLMHAGSLKNIRLAGWAVLLIAGLVQTWDVRHRIFSDGISYLDIASYYSQGDLAHAVNAYWSPLYSWILAVPLSLIRVDGYWDVMLLHLVNFSAYVASLALFELLLGELLKYRAGLIDAPSRAVHLLSDTTVRIAGYSVFALAELRMIGIGYCSPDMIATSTGFYIAYVLCRIANKRTSILLFVGLGAALALTYLARAAFAPMIVVNVLVLAWLLFKTRQPVLVPVCVACAAVAVIALPWVTVLSTSKGHLTLGESGKLNYAWEVDGAARSTHWQGEPYNIGVPRHPTHRVIDHPETYTFAEPVPGSYPPWYEPSYWYEGVAPRLEIGRQWNVLRASLVQDVYLLLLSPVTIPCIGLLFWAGLRLWTSRRGILAYWFLIVPALVYTGAYSVVYMDRRYIAGSLALLWVCFTASLLSKPGRISPYLNTAMQAWIILFSFAYVGSRMVQPTALALRDLAHRSEAEWNLQWILAQHIRKLGVDSGSKVAYIGESINAEWARLDHVRIVAEVPVIWERLDNLNRGIFADPREVKAFWRGDEQSRVRVLNAFRKAGASVVFADPPPPGSNMAGWQRVLPPDIAHLPWSGGQVGVVPGLLYHRLAAGSD